MEEKINIKINELLELLDNDKRITSITNIKNRLINDSDTIEKLEKLRKLDKYSYEYKNLKKVLFENKDFVEFKKLENEINLLILEINSKLKTLTNKKECNNESN